MNSVIHTTAPCTESQVSFIARLVKDRELDEHLQNKVNAARKLVMAGRLNRIKASELIDALLDAPKHQPVGEIEAGVYREVGGNHLVRVYWGQQSGQMLAKEICSDEWGTMSYAYLGSARKAMAGTSYTRLSLEEVGSLGKHFSRCMLCGRRLDDPESVDRGIGPVCAEKY